MPLATLLGRVGADLSARYVSFKCFDGYSTSIDMASALQPQTMLALDFEEKPLAPAVGRAAAAAHPHQARFQERRTTWRPSKSPTPIPEVTGRTRATTGSPAFDGAAGRRLSRRRDPDEIPDTRLTGIRLGTSVL